MCFPSTAMLAISTGVMHSGTTNLFKLIKPGYMFHLYSHHQACLQSLVELYMLNAYVMWDPSSEATICADGIKT
jgi:hypothetical protein